MLYDFWMFIAWYFIPFRLLNYFLLLVNLHLFIIIIILCLTANIISWDNTSSIIYIIWFGSLMMCRSCDPRSFFRSWFLSTKFNVTCLLLLLLLYSCINLILLLSLNSCTLCLQLLHRRYLVNIIIIIIWLYTINIIHIIMLLVVNTMTYHHIVWVI